MYSIGDKVVYGTLGVMEITDITEQKIGDITKSYYVLKELSGISSSLTYVPIDSDTLTAQMRKLLTKEQISAILEQLKTEPQLDWIEDNRARSNEYKKIIASGDYAKMLLMMRFVYETGKRREEEGKKNYLADEASMKKAEKLIFSEFALVLGIDESAVPGFIADSMNSSAV